jgi:hypothetical protein
VVAKRQNAHRSQIQCKPLWATSVQTATPKSVSAKKTVKKPSKQAWSVAHVLPAAHHAVAVLPVAALVAVAQVAVTQVTVAEVADKSQRRCTKNACTFKGNPLKRLK